MLSRCLIVVALVGCGDDPFTGLLKPPPTSEGMQLSLSTHVEPGQEITVCKNFAVPEGAFDIGKFEHAMTDVSHHILVYQLDIAASEITDAVIPACDEMPDNQKHRSGFIYGAQGPSGELTLPRGIAFPTRGGLSLQLEYHVFNTSDQAVDAQAAFNLWRAKGDITGEAGMVFLFNNRITLPPMSKGTARLHRTYPTDFNLMMLVPHMHSRGVAMEAYRETGTGSPQQLFSVTGWENDTKYFDPPIAFQPGDTLDYHCDYDNTTSDYIFDGFSAKHDEMCVTGGIYWRNGDRMPLTNEITFGSIPTGSASCTQVQACDEAIDYSNTSVTPTAYEQYDMCMNKGCPAATAAYQALDNCRFQSCKDACFTLDSNMIVVGLKTSDPACTSCVDTSCASQRDACPTTGCP